jgi:hypothetical protein
VASIVALEELDLQRCERVDCEILCRIATLTGLRTLKLSNCGCVTDEGLAHLARGCRALTR